MAKHKYTVRYRTNNYAYMVNLYRVNDEIQQKIDEAGGIEEIDTWFMEDNIRDSHEFDYQTIVMNVDNFLDTEVYDFELSVEDEEGNVVYETTDPESINCYNPYCKFIKDEAELEEGEFEEDYRYAPNFEFKGVEDGLYLVENYGLYRSQFIGEFEADDFDPSKLSFHPSEIFDNMICEDDVFLKELRYDNQKIATDLEDYWDRTDTNGYKLLEAKKHSYKDFDGRELFSNFDEHRIW